MTKIGEIPPEVLDDTKKIIADIKKLGPTAFLAQYAIWANFYIQSATDRGRGAAMTRVEQAMPLVFFLIGMAGKTLKDPDAVDSCMAALEKGAVRALFQAKLDDRHEVHLEDMAGVMEWVVSEATGAP
jgi:hypothetical protein